VFESLKINLEGDKSGAMLLESGFSTSKAGARNSLSFYGSVPDT